MAVKIRLKRMGKIRTPFYRITSERAQYWLGVGAQPTEAVAAILKLTGDIGGNATLKQPEPKSDKAAAFEKALKELHTDLPKAKPAKKAKAEEPEAEEAKAKKTKVEEAPAEEAAAAAAPVEEAAAEAPAEEAAEAPVEEAAADAPAAEEVPAEEAPADAPAEDTVSEA